MNLRRRSLRILAILLVVVALAVLAIVWLRRARSPEAVRLLPEADAVIYLDVKTLRALGAFSGGEISREPEYEEFVRETGFQFERDLDQAAFAVHAGKAAVPPGAPALASDTRFSEIFIGRYDVARAAAYFKRIAKSTERYRDVDIYLIARGGWDSRVALLGIDRAAVSTADSPTAMHMMIDHYRAGALHTAGPSVVSAHRDHIPLGSLAWAIVRLSDGSGRGIPAPGMLANLGGTTVVVSVRPMFGGAQLRVEDLAPDAERAQRITESGNTMLGMFKQIEAGSTPSGPDEDVKKMFESISIAQDGKSAVLTATITKSFLDKLIAPGIDGMSAAPPPAPTPTPTSSPKKRKK
jgi:hypothetical protein